MWLRDLAESFLLAAEKSGINGDVFIIAGENSLPLKELAGIIADLMGVTEPWLHLPVKPMQILGSLCEAICTPLKINPPLFRRRVDFFTKDRSFDISKAREKLGYRPQRSLIQELIDIIDSYVKSGAINVDRVKRPSVMLRAMNGEIRVWNEGDKPIYGWTREQAVGNVSHALLKTDFPIDLAAIHKSLETRGRWKGHLIHRNREGKSVRVISKWKLLDLPRNSDPLILELNHPVEGANSTLNSSVGCLLGSLASHMPEVFSVLCRAPLEVLV